MLTQEELKKLVRYDPDTGDMIKLPRPREMFNSDREFKSWNTRFANKLIRRPSKFGYYRVTINKKEYKVHRLAWLYVYGKFPALDLDHINGLKNDNRISNLREVTVSDNQKNTKKQKNNKSGYTGISWNKKLNKWQVRITSNKKRFHLGVFDSKQDAIKARKEAEIKYGFHENHGR